MPENIWPWWFNIDCGHYHRWWNVDLLTPPLQNRQTSKFGLKEMGPKVSSDLARVFFPFFFQFIMDVWLWIYCLGGKQSLTCITLELCSSRYWLKSQWPLGVITRNLVSSWWCLTAMRHRQSRDFLKKRISNHSPSSLFYWFGPIYSFGFLGILGTSEYWRNERHLIAFYVHELYFAIETY